MNELKLIFMHALAYAVLTVGTVRGSTETTGPNGINSDPLFNAQGAVLTGSGIAIGQVEPSRPGDPNFDTDDSLFHLLVRPTGVFHRNPGSVSFDPIMNEPTEIIDVGAGGHATWVAGVMISTDISDPDMDGDVPIGVATGARLYAAGFNPMGPNLDEEAAITLQHLSTLPGVNIRAINMSFGTPLRDSHVLDGNSHLTLFIDWSAAAHDVLYVRAGNETIHGAPQSTDACPSWNLPNAR